MGGYLVVGFSTWLLGLWLFGCCVVFLVAWFVGGWLFGCLKGWWVGGWPPGRPRSKLGGERNQKLQYTLHIQDNYTICFQCRFNIFNLSLRTIYL